MRSGGRLVCWLGSWLVVCFAACLLRCLVVLLLGCLVSGWLVCLLVGWLEAWLRRGLLDAWMDLICFLVSVIGLTGSDDSYSSEGPASEALSLDEQG